MLDFNHGATKPTTGIADLTARINAVIDKALQEAETKRPARHYLGASLIGEPCQRKIQYTYQRSESQPRDGKSLRILAVGHVFEEMTALELKLAGFDLRTHQTDGSQFGFSVADGRIGGHIDGVICDGPVTMQYPALWEHKALGQKSWNEMVKRGVTVARPVYAAQIALYQAYMDLTEAPALFTARNRDTQELYHEAVPFDAALAQQMSDRALQILEATKAREVLPRVTKNPGYFQCRWCEFSESCWR